MKATAPLQKETLKPASFASAGTATHNPLQLKSTSVQQNPLQLKKANKTGLPDGLKSGVEALSGYSMDDVQVHYNSDKPGQLQALAYAQGTDIHVAPGQEKHLPHEAWHVVQQKQGRVRPTVQMKRGVAVNDDKRLEKEADTMLAKYHSPAGIIINPLPAIMHPKEAVVQRMEGDGEAVPFDFWQLLLYYSVTQVLPQVVEKVVTYVYDRLVQQPEVVKTVQEVASSTSTETKAETTKLAIELKENILELSEEVQQAAGNKQHSLSENETKEIKTQQTDLHEPPKHLLPIEEIKAVLNVAPDLALEPVNESKIETQFNPTDNKPHIAEEKKKPYSAKSKKQRQRRNNKKFEPTYETSESEGSTIATPVKNNGFSVREKDLKKAAKETNKEQDELVALANWVSDAEMWNAFTQNSAVAERGIELAYSSILPTELKDWKQQEETDYDDAAKTLLEFKKKQSQPKKPVKEVKQVQKNTLTQVEKYWSKGEQDMKGGLEGGNLSVAVSKSGGGMLLLKGLKVSSLNQNAHISLPSDGNGSFSEGHLKVEGGELLNQYFFSVDDSGKITKLTNSPTVPTQNPGKWSKLPSNVWASVNDIIRNLATGNLG